MENEIIHWFDADYTLWDTNAKWWIISKKNPSKPIIRITQYEGYLILSGHYSKDGHNIYYNGKEGWLSDDIWLKTQRTKAIDIEDIGISFREYLDPELIEKQYKNLIIHIDRIQHIAGKKDIINLLTARGNRK